MAPSRGAVVPRNAPASASASAGDDDAEVDAQSRSALQSAKRNIRYLYNPSSPVARPARFRTRALLRAVRYSVIFIFWRLVRWAKYAAIASLVTAVGATALGSVASGAAFVLAPTGIAGTIVAGTVWGVGRWGARRLSTRWQHNAGDGKGSEVRGTNAIPLKQRPDPQAMPW